ncbi:retroelement silencing factor 1-like [Sceloporus undulatus]|uniref:retroelement silencing factor 1-like n=1 Tax=Sceloporus undulatus TaxID=8520 RepID=UPI001C4B3FA6|nr:retroelement silencing factor 1-like [Sceloporus undulatus]
MILNSEQMKEVFPERKQQFLNKSENSEDDGFKTDSEANLTRKNISPVTTDKAVAKETSLETTLKSEVPTYCCTKAWIATGYVTGPCQCVLAKELGSKQDVDLCSQSKPSGNSNVDSKLNSQLPISTLDTVTKTQRDRTLIKISGPKTANEFKPHRVDQAVSRLPSFKKLNLQNPKQNNEHVRKELSHHASSQPLNIAMEAVEISTTRDNICARGNSSTAGARSLSKTEDVAVVRNFCRNEQKTNKVDTFRHRRIEIKHSTNYERYKIKRDSSETHMIKGPTHKSLKRQKAIEKKRKALAIQHNDAISASNINNVGSFSQTGEKPQHISTSQSQEHLNGKKFVNIRDLEKHYGYKKVEHKERTYSALNEYQSEGTEHPSEHTKPIKRINLEKYAYSKERKKAWKCRSSHLDNGKTRTPQKQRVRPPGISKMCSPGKEVMLDANKREKWSERSLSDKKSCFNRRTNKLSMFLQREPKKTYLNRVAFRRTAHKTIFLTNIEPSHSKSVWHVKSCSLSGLSKEKRKSSLPPQQPEAEKPPMLQFKMCPDILFRNPVTEEQISDARELPEKDRAPVTGM